MGDLDVLLSRFIDEWNAGSRPSVEACLQQVPAGELRDELADRISIFLSYAPSPRYDEDEIGRLLEESAVEAAASAFESEHSAWPLFLPRMRERAGLSLGALASRVLAVAGLGEAGQEKATRHLADMERGELDAGNLSGRLLTALSEALGIDREDLERTGMPAGRAATAVAFRRQAEGDDAEARVELLVDALVTPAMGRDWDEVDKLFFRRE